MFSTGATRTTTSLFIKKRNSVQWTRVKLLFLRKYHVSLPTNKVSERPSEIHNASVKDISELFDIDKSRSMEIAKQLSSNARNELSSLKSKLKDTTSTTTQKPTAIDKVVQPSMKDLKRHALTCGIPFIGFGICDNAILILAGDFIDQNLGVMFAISTLCAAAIGNIISDIAGVGLGAYIEDFCATKLHLPKANLTSAQRSLRSVRMAGQFGNMLGLTIGCIIGMFPLLFIDSEEVQQKKKDAYMDQIFNDVVTEAKGMIGAESTRLYLIVNENDIDRPTPFTPKSKDVDGKYLYAKYETDRTKLMTSEAGFKQPISQGIVGRAATTGEVIFVADIVNDPEYDSSSSSIHQTSGGNVKSMLCVPVYDVHGNTIAVIQAINKVREGNTTRASSRIGIYKRFTNKKAETAFTVDDAKILQTLASHISVSLQNIHREEDASLKEIVKILREHDSKTKQ